MKLFLRFSIVGLIGVRFSFKSIRNTYIQTSLLIEALAVAAPRAPNTGGFFILLRFLTLKQGICPENKYHSAQRRINCIWADMSFIYFFFVGIELVSGYTSTQSVLECVDKSLKADAMEAEVVCKLLLFVPIPHSP